MMPAFSGTTADDVDLLPWNLTGRHVNIAKMQRYINDGFKKQFAPRTTTTSPAPRQTRILPRILTRNTINFIGIANDTNWGFWGLDSFENSTITMTKGRRYYTKGTHYYTIFHLTQYFMNNNTTTICFMTNYNKKEELALWRSFDRMRNGRTSACQCLFDSFYTESI